MVTCKLIHVVYVTFDLIYLVSLTYDLLNVVHLSHNLMNVDSAFSRPSPQIVKEIADRWFQVSQLSF